MSKLKSTLGIVAIAFITLTAVSCKDNKKEQNNTEGNHSEMNADEDHSKMDHDNSDGHHDSDKKEMAMSGDGDSELILKDYFNLKDALVADNNAKAKDLGANLVTSLGNLDISSNFSDTQKIELKDIIEDAVEHAEHISESDIDHQREHFKILSKDVTDMVAITGTENTLYQLFCPMYDGGSAWLSMSKEIKNPYYGSKMLDCGEVQKEIK
ncbi:DUF3347 domain-containing protein [Aequorivita antarctica]|uniref:DUF3347 domain-containing protein n=1 Tax=Aequorivita antarctica TaxID=153266 RepID=A0A5C6Z1X8_9FLAO|nr:DUF3347 domain-containing protein [Aequorivita antarctica]TXD73503.1 DUF3347 domain-containing protein [Aequorivita antarctica]SRX75705.1 hypothetical protein AEQU3_02701 [Aequorivita antarctica]